MQPLLISASIIAPVIIGATLALVSAKYALLVTAIILTPSLFLLTPDLLILLTALFAMVLVGISDYFMHISIYWLPFILGMLLYPYILAHQLIPNNYPQAAPRPVTLLQMSALGLFFLSAVVATILESPPGYHLLVSSRDYFFLWSIYWIIALGLVSTDFPLRLWRFLYWVALIQAPIATIQYAVFALHRTDQTKWDSVVGSFIGREFGGGDSGGMTIFLFVAWTLTYYLAQNRVITKSHLLLVGGVTLLFISLAEVKVALVLIMTFAGWIAISRFHSRFFTSLTALAIGLILTAGITLAYLHTEKQSGVDTQGSMEARIDKMLSYSLDPDNISPNGDVGRMAALAIWWKNNDLSTDPYHFLFGYGLGSTTTSRKGMGVIAMRFSPLHIDPSAMTILLWDTGLTGFLFFTAFLLITLIRAIKLSALSLSPSGSAIASSLPACLLYFLVSIPYNKDLISTSPAIQLLFLALCGLVSYFYRVNTSYGPARTPQLAQ